MGCICSTPVKKNESPDLDLVFARRRERHSSTTPHRRTPASSVTTLHEELRQASGLPKASGHSRMWSTPGSEKISFTLAKVVNSNGTLSREVSMTLGRITNCNLHGGTQQGTFLLQDNTTGNIIPLTKQIGKGGFGRVFLGEFEGKQVAVKAVLGERRAPKPMGNKRGTKGGMPGSSQGDEDSPYEEAADAEEEQQIRDENMAQLEAVLMTVMNHENIVKTYKCLSSFQLTEPEVPPSPASAKPGSSSTRGQRQVAPSMMLYEWFIIMEYCNGGSLSSALANGRFHQRALPVAAHQHMIKQQELAAQQELARQQQHKAGMGAVAPPAVSGLAAVARSPGSSTALQRVKSPWQDPAVQASQNSEFQKKQQAVLQNPLFDAPPDALLPPQVSAPGNTGNSKSQPLPHLATHASEGSTIPKPTNPYASQPLTGVPRVPAASEGGQYGRSAGAQEMSRLALANSAMQLQQQQLLQQASAPQQLLEWDAWAALETLKEVARALAYMQDNDLLHGDLKAGNVLLASSNHDRRGFVVKVTDFGFSRILKRKEITTKTYGTVTHMPPELLKEGNLTPACDTFSFGVLMWEVYTARSVYREMRENEIVLRVVNEKMRPVFPPDTPQRFVRLAEACWAEEADARPGIISVITELCALQDELCPQGPASPAIVVSGVLPRSRRASMPAGGHDPAFAGGALQPVGYGAAYGGTHGSGEVPPYAGGAHANGSPFKPQPLGSTQSTPGVTVPPFAVSGPTYHQSAAMFLGKAGSGDRNKTPPRRSLTPVLSGKYAGAEEPARLAATSESIRRNADRAAAAAAAVDAIDSESHHHHHRGGDGSGRRGSGSPQLPPGLAEARGSGGYGHSHSQEGCSASYTRAEVGLSPRDSDRSTGGTGTPARGASGASPNLSPRGSANPPTPGSSGTPTGASSSALLPEQPGPSGAFGSAAAGAIAAAAASVTVQASGNSQQGAGAGAAGEMGERGERVVQAYPSLKGWGPNRLRSELSPIPSLSGTEGAPSRGSADVSSSQANSRKDL